MNKIIYLLLPLMAVSSCSVQQSITAKKAKTKLVGLSKVALYKCAGTPSRKETINGTEFLTYRSEGGGTNEDEST